MDNCFHEKCIFLIKNFYYYELCPVYYFGVEMTEWGLEIMVYKSIMRSVVKIVCNDRIIALEKRQNL
jgi:hypothetical protein